MSGVSCLLSKGTDDTWCRRLAKSSCEAVGLAAAAEPVRKWLAYEETKQQLIEARRDETVRALVASLSQALEDDWADKVPMTRSGLISK